MRVLMIHCEEFEYEVTKETPIAEPASEKEGKADDVLVYFVCYEKKDEQDAELMKKFIDSVKTDITRIGKKTIMIYPYAHLSKNLGSARLAKEFLNVLRRKLEDDGLEVMKSPFGWYKKFKLECIGHPLSESFREF